MGHTKLEIIGLNRYYMEEVTSTNDVARNYFTEGKAHHGDVLIAEYQTKGKGQQGNSWESAHGQNLLFTVLLEPDFLSSEDLIYLNIAISLALQHAIQKNITDKVYIKWPNDIYIENRKVAGILVENILGNPQVKLTIAGIGINVNQQGFNSPHAVSIGQVTQQWHDKEIILNQFLEGLRIQYQRLIKEDWLGFMEDFHSVLFRYKKETGFMKDNRKFTAKVMGMDAAGRLALEVDGKLAYFHHKEIEWII